MNSRTDLVSEEKLDIKAKTEAKGDVSFSFAELKGGIGKSIGKNDGIYCTVSFKQIDKMQTDIIKDYVIKALKTFFKKPPENVLVAGLGNRDVTFDALGVITAKKVLATRHLKEFENLKKVSVLCPDVVGKTGIESYGIISAVANAVKPDLIIVIDALSTRSAKNIFCSIQLTNSGINAGSGVMGQRKEISFNTMKTPVIAIGMPTVTDLGDGIVATRKDTDLLTKLSADLLSDCINRYLLPELS